MDISIIIVSCNTKELLKNCFESILKLEDWKKVKGEVIVVDNGSSDESVEMIRELAKKNLELGIKIVENKQNLGFSKANNQGIRISEGEYILMLNSDTETRSGALEKLITFSKAHTEAGLVSARLLNPDGSIQPSVYYFPTIKRVFDEIFIKNGSYFEKYLIQGDRSVEVEAVVFAAVLIPRKTIEKVGLLDERYFMYFEDLDYCRRIHGAGLKIYYLPAAEIIHHHGASGKGSGKIYDYSTESSKIYHGKIKFWLLKIILRGIHKWQKISGKR